VLVTAHEQARHSDPNTPPLVIAGPGGWGAPLQHDSRHVVRAGFLSDRDLRAVVASATALAVPSLYEGFGLPALEAMACGTPVIASTAAALAEVVGSAGTLVPAEDVDGWAQAIVEASFPPSPERVAMARERARQFTWQNSAEIHLRAYRLAADRGRF
jgi:glycosyltransferase involved in cell wall biosynthesis